MRFRTSSKTLLRRRSYEDALTEGGFEPAIAGSGEKAVTLLIESKSKFRALVTDANLGRDGMNGWEVAERAREIDPEFPVVYMTGDSADDWGSQGFPTASFRPSRLRLPNFSIPGSRQRKAASIGGLTISLLHIATAYHAHVRSRRRFSQPGDGFLLFAAGAARQRVWSVLTYRAGSDY
jgi:CheY-like chemotaxis protein